MKKILFILIAIVLIIVGVFLFIRSRDKGADKSISTPLEQTEQKAQYINTDIGVQFSYRTSPNGYTVQDKYPDGKGGELIQTIILIRNEDINKPAPSGSEGAPTITINIFENTQKQSPQAWADTHKIYSNINLKLGQVYQTALGEVSAIRYKADGLYVSDNVVVALGDYVYVISGMYTDENSEIRKDFQPILDSFKFIKAPSQE